MDFKGVIPPMITPFKEDGEVDYRAFERNINKWNEDKLSGYLVLGSNSETVYLTEKEKLELIEITVRNAAPDRHVIVGSGHESLRESIRFTNLAARKGCGSALVLTPFYYGDDMTSEALIEYFSELADNCDIPIMIYNVPKFTHVNIKADAVIELAKHPNIIGMKDSSGDVPQLATLKRVVPEDFNLLVGTASAWYPALTFGIRAGIMALANCSPNECAAVQEAYDAGESQKAYALYQKIFPLNTAVTAKYGIAGLKYACTKLGYSGGYVRSPLLPFAEENQAVLDQIMVKALH